MILYWLLFFLPVAFVLFPHRAYRDRNNPVLYLIGTIITLFIGLRHEVGGDWGGYLAKYESSIGKPFSEVISLWDPGYMALNWIAGQMNLGIYGVNLFCGSIFMVGLIRFLRTLPLPRLALVAAVPYLIIVVSMGYGRQSCALGLFLWGLSYLQEGRISLFLILVLIASTFHKSALLMIILAYFGQERIGYLRLIGITLLLLLAMCGYFLDSYGSYIHNYIINSGAMLSSGGLPRLFMNALASIIFLIFRKRWRMSTGNVKMWSIMAMISLTALPMAFFYSTASDRISIYLLPMQLLVCSMLPLLYKDTFERKFIIICIILFYAANQWVWLNYANHAYAWLPYRNILLE